jgi:transposase
MNIGLKFRILKIFKSYLPLTTNLKYRNTLQALSKSTISKLLKRWRERGDTENKPRKGRSKFVSKRGERVLNRINRVITLSYLVLYFYCNYDNI